MNRRAFLCLLLCASACYSVLFPLTNTDIWWHLAAGRLILQEGRFLYADPFSSGALGRPWIDLHWLFQVMAHSLYRMGGVSALVLAKALVCGLGAALLCLIATQKVQPRWRPLGILAMALAIYLGRHLVLARPIVLTLLCLSFFLVLLERFRLQGKIRWLLLLLPVQVFWANTQALFILGPVMLAAYLTGEGLSALLGRQGIMGFSGALGRRGVVLLGIFLPLLVAASLLTPYGWQGLQLPFLLFGRIDSVGADLFTYNVSENIPPWVMERTGPSLVKGFKWVAAATWVTFLMVPRRKIVLSRFLVVGVMFGLALLARRNMLLFYWVAGPMLAINLGQALEAVARSRARLAQHIERAVPPALLKHLLPALMTLGLAVMGLLTHRASQDEPPLASVAPFRVPLGGVQRIKDLGLERHKIFNSVRYGGYLAWSLYPDGRPFIDGRLVIRTAAHFAEHLALADDPGTFEDFARSRRIRTVLLPTASPDRYLPLAAWLYRSPQWRLIHTDGIETLFVREGGELPGAAAAMDLSDAPTVQQILSRLRAAHGYSDRVLEQAILHLGRFLAEAGELGQARRVLGACTLHRARSLLARVWYLDGEVGRGEALDRQQLEERPDDADSLYLLALIATDQARHADAIQLIEQVLALDPFHRHARLLLLRINKESGRRGRGRGPRH